jgi:hypothetical protein
MKRAAPTVALMAIAAMLGGALAFAVAAVFADDETTILVPVRMLATRLAECKEKGGCSFLTRAEIAELHEHGKTEGRTEAFESLNSDGCRMDRS